MRRFGPRPDTAPQLNCPICGRAFQPGDYTTLVGREAADAEELVNMAAGRPYLAKAEEVCWDHAAAISYATGEAITE